MTGVRPNMVPFGPKIAKHGRLVNVPKWSKRDQNCQPKCFIWPWMASYGPKRCFLLTFSARDDLVKVPWKSDARNCQNQLTPPLLWLAEWNVPAPFFFGHGARISGQLDYISNWQLKVQWWLAGRPFWQATILISSVFRELELAGWSCGLFICRQILKILFTGFIRMAWTQMSSE